MKNIKRSSNHLVRNSYSYCFRMRIPEDLYAYIGRKELRYSLKTGYLSEAKHKSNIIAIQVHNLFKSLRRGRSLMKELSDTQIKEIVSDYLRAYIDGLETRYYDDNEYFGTRDDFYNYVKGLDDIKTDVIGYLGIGDYSTVKDIADHYIKQHDINSADKKSLAYIKLCREILRAQLKGINIEKEQMLGGGITETSKASQAKETPLQIESPQSGKLSELIKAYCAEKEKAGRWSNRTKTEYATCFQLILKIVGDVPVHEVNRQTMKQYKEAIVKIPAYLNSEKYKNKSIDEIISMKHDKTLSVTSINKYLDAAKALFGFAVNNDYMLKNPALDFNIKQDKRPDEQREAFNQKDLEMLFSSEKYKKDKHKHPFQFWLPILALYTGCRIEELCQLYVKDIIKDDDGIWVLVIEDDDDKHIKNKHSKRLIPLHPIIVNDLKFPEFVKSKEGNESGRVFTELKKRNSRYSHYPTQWFKTYKEQCGIINKNKVFHSFRHTLTDNLKQQEIEWSLIDELTGHALTGESKGRYGKRYKPKVLYEGTILKLKYGIDLSHLKNSKWVIKD